MSNIINLVKKNIIQTNSNMGSNTRGYKKEIPMNKEWHNSLYCFNKNLIRFLPSVYNITFKLLKLYFNMTSELFDKKISLRKDKKAQRMSGRKIWISNPEIKHKSDELTITVYTYNRTYNFYKEKIELLGFTWSFLQSPSDEFEEDNLLFLKSKLPYTGNDKIMLHKYYNHYTYIIKLLKWSKYEQMTQYKSCLTDLIKQNKKEKIIEFLKLLKFEHYNYLIDQFSKELLYLKYKQKILFNEFKHNELYLSSIIGFLQTIYKKKIQCNIITLKYHYLSANILLQIIATKIKSPNKRGKYTIPVDSAMGWVKVPNLSKKKFEGETRHYIGTQNVKLNKFISSKDDKLSKFLTKNKKLFVEHANVNKLVLSNLENKTLSGLFINIAGRLTKRYKAQRAIETLRFRGRLQNVYSAHRNFPSSLSRGYSNINVEKARIDSKVRIGSFGLTGWLASY